jgi:hypothetical protein
MRLAGTVFSGLSALVIEDVQDAGELICVRARTAGRAVPWPGCAAVTARVHGYHERTVADVPVDGRRVVVRVTVRRMRRPVRGCPRQTFREQVPGVPGRYQRRTPRLTGQAGAVARALAGRAGSRLLAQLGVPLSRQSFAARRWGLAVVVAGQAAGHDDDGGPVDHGRGVRGGALAVAGQAAVAHQPAEGALDDPAAAQHLEGVRATTSTMMAATAWAYLASGLPLYPVSAHMILSVLKASNRRMSRIFAPALSLTDAAMTTSTRPMAHGIKFE